jgi:protein-tyrosine-phosphatase
MTRRILFVCEHGSAKSVIAAAHCDRIARERGIDARATSRGTDPDAEYPPHVISGLESDALEPLESAPAALSQSDIDSADTIITFCSPTMINAMPDDVWDDVPSVSGGYDRARDEIVLRVERLLAPEVA